MEIDELLVMINESLEAEKAESLKEGVISLLNAEKERGIQTYTKKDKEAMKLKEVLRSLGYDKDQYDTYDDFVSKKREGESKKYETDLTLSSLNEKINALNSQLNAERAEKEAISRKIKTEKARSILSSELSDKVYGAKYLIESLISNNDFDIDGDNVYTKIGDEKKHITKLIEEVLDQNKDILKINQRPGAEAKPSGDNVSQHALTLEKINKMTPEEIKLHLNDIRKLAKL
jgi:hypothetical protein